MGSIVYSVEPTIPPVTLSDVKSHLRVDHNFDDDLIQGYLWAATTYAQEYCWSQLITATFIQKWDRFPGALILDRNPVVSVGTVQYVDSGGTTQALTVTTDYVVDVNVKPCRILPAYSKWWPATRGFMNDVTVTFDAGYGPSEKTTPWEVRAAILLYVEQLYSPCDQDAVKGMRMKGLLDLRSFRTFY